MKARADYLGQVRALTPRVSVPLLERLNPWKAGGSDLPNFRRRENTRMFSLVTSAILGLAAMLGAGASTVALAQGAEPGQPLYPVKTWSEDAVLALQPSADSRLTTTLGFSERRVAEIQSSLLADRGVPDLVMLRLQSQLQQAMALAVAMPDEALIPSLERIRDRARLQEQAMLQLKLASDDALQHRLLTISMLQAQALIAQGGIDDPTWMRLQYQAGQQFVSPTGSQGAGGNGQGSPSDGSQGADQGSGGGPGGPKNTDPHGTSVPGSGSAPISPQHPWVDGTATPDPSQWPAGSQNPCVDGTPMPGSCHGPGECTWCTPQPGGAGGSNGNGPGG
jgi:hypothetical protein